MEEKIREKLSVVPDYRHSSYIGHKLSDVLIIVMTAVICGLDQLNEIMVYAHEKSDFFARHFNITKIPSKPTMSRILNMIKAEAVTNVIINIMKDEAKYLGEIVAFDGKAIRSTSEKGKPHSALQILTAYMVESGVVLAQESIHEKTNEIPIMREILDYIDVKGKIITTDALHCQRETCAKIVDDEHGGDYVIGLKGNQETLHDDAALFFYDEINNESIETHKETELNGGRIENRTCRKTKDIDFLSYHEWPGLKSIFEVRRIITSKNGSTKTDETSYYISSLDTTAEEFLHISRAHWKIESMHWMLDEDFSEDKCELLSENGQKSLNIFRKFALFIHKTFMDKQPKKRSIKSNLLRCLVSESALLEVFRSL
jgi:predicted transposase YbfD/YdcC